MRRLFVLTVAVTAMVLGASVGWAGNQEEANRIAKKLGETFPQYSIEVAYQEGNVRLRGEVGTPGDKAEIKRFVSTIPKVRTVSESFVVTEKPAVVEESPVVVEEKPVVVTEVPDSKPQTNESYAEQTSPISTTLQSETILPVSALRADNPIYIAQTPADQTYLSDSTPLPVPPAIVNESDSIPMISDQQTPMMNEQQMPMMNNQQMPMGTVITENGAPAYSQAVGGSADYLPPQGRTMMPGQSAQPNMPNYSWPTTADYPNYSQVSYPKQYAAGAFPFIGPFYPYPQVPLGWRKVTMEWHDGYWWLDFNDGSASGPFSPLFRQPTKYR